MIIGSSILNQGQLLHAQLIATDPIYLNYPGAPYRTDFGLIKLTTDMALNVHNTSAVCLPQSYHNYTEPEYGLIAGWGCHYTFQQFIESITADRMG